MKGTNLFCRALPKASDSFPILQRASWKKELYFRKRKLKPAGIIPDFFRIMRRHWLCSIFHLAVQTKVSFDRVGMLPGMQVFTEGGFAKNDAYNRLMTAFFPGSSFYLTNLKQATAFGAAMCGKAAMDQIDIKSLRHAVELEKKPVNPTKIHGLDGYFEKFIDMV
jgi:hypothetical protein